MTLYIDNISTSYLVPTRVVKSILPVIVTPLTKLINSSFERGVFPQALKFARTIVIQKGGSTSDFSN